MHLPRRVVGLNEFISVKCLEQGLAHRKCYVSVSWCCSETLMVYCTGISQNYYMYIYS